MEVIEYLSEDEPKRRRRVEVLGTVDVYNYLGLGTRLHQIQYMYNSDYCTSFAWLSYEQRSMTSSEDDS